MSDLERARSALMLEIGAWGINLNASEDVDARVVALIAAVKREGVAEERERCVKAACCYCRAGIPFNAEFKAHVNCMPCGAAAILAGDKEGG